MTTQTETTPDAMVAFELIYRSNVAAISGYFARRCTDPQAVADLTQETFVQAIGSLAGYDPTRGGERGWLFGIARRVFARHCDGIALSLDAGARLAGRRELAGDEVEELAARIDAERAGRALLQRAQGLPAVEQQALELVDIGGLTPREAAAALDISAGALRVRLFRARNKLRTRQEER